MSIATLPELTEATLEGSGAFDVVMRAAKAHMQHEFEKNRIRGPEYAEVYLGGLQAAMAHALQFLLTKEKAELEAGLILQQTANLAAEGLNIPKQGLVLEAEKANLVAEGLNIPKQGLVLEAEKAKLDADTLILGQQLLSEIQNTAVLFAQKCKLEAEFDVLMLTKDKVIAETALLNQKRITEQAQTIAAGVDPDSVIGKQKLLFQRQADGFLRDAEQKAAKIFVDTWNVRRTTDSGTVADATNKLNDVTIGSMVQKLLDGVSVV